MATFLIFGFCLFCLFVTQKWLMVQISKLIHRLGGSRNSLIVVWSIIFLPGTVIHELSHFLFAILTGAKTGKIEIFPRFLEEDWEDEEGGGNVTLGYVQTQRLNPIQGLFVGLAPFILGMAMLVWISTQIQVSYLSASYYLLVFQGYLFFTISNSFFPSSSDLKHVYPVAITLIIVLAALWFFGINFLVTPSADFFDLLNTISLTLMFSAILNLFITATLFFLNKLFRKSKSR
jgi:hypothetical protein